MLNAAKGKPLIGSMSDPLTIPPTLIPGADNVTMDPFTVAGPLLVTTTLSPPSIFAAPAMAVNVMFPTAMSAENFSGLSSKLFVPARTFQEPTSQVYDISPTRIVVEWLPFSIVSLRSPYLMR